MGLSEARDTKFGYCIDCRDDDHEACKSDQCRCRDTKDHQEAVAGAPEEPVPEEFVWEDPPPQRGRHPLTPEKQIALKTRPGKFAHIKHFDGKTSAYQVVKNFNAGKYKDLDISMWSFQDIKNGVHGPGSDVYAAYIGDD